MIALSRIAAVCGLSLLASGLAHAEDWKLAKDEETRGKKAKEKVTRVRLVLEKVIRDNPLEWEKEHLA